ncbi:QWRF motif-containing protein 3-like [Lotus japonicus]|uniref:QWRF motif-containing protein 3-like n=1 Tax=Lotus japonicus TaxID=34305 RepID=UPI00258660C1|nr:QWRF motif-containing protein 3-like [Lotus japonicus]XP_057455453.1 QWRF motif-containing protein 3-like [Lotus japonicus]
MKTQKPRQHRNREAGSRFTSSPDHSLTTTIESIECNSPARRSTDTRRHHKITEDTTLTRRQLWPSTAKKNSGTTTLADHITEDRIIEQQLDNKKEKSIRFYSHRVSSSAGFNDVTTASSTFKENDQQQHGSARFSGRFFASSIGESSPSSSLKKQANSGSGSIRSTIVPGRLSLDERAKPISSSRRMLNSLDLESQSGDSGKTLSPRKSTGVEVKSRFRSRRGASDSNIGNLDGDSSSALKKSVLKSAIKRANSLAGYKSSKSQWALSPGRSDSPAMSVENMEKPVLFSTPTSPAPFTKVKGVEKILNLGFDFFKTKKSSVVNSSPLAFGNSENVHRLRLLDNRLIQWRYANARAQVVNANISHHAESNLVCAWDTLTKLRQSVLKKKIQFYREKLDMKVAFILYYQMKLLEAWGGMERQHVSALNVTKECLHSVVCRVPLLEGAKVNLQSTSLALRQASDLTSSIKSILTSFSPPQIDKTAAMVSELAKVVALEKQLIEEFYDLFQATSVFEIQESSVKCNLVQLESWQQKYKQRQLLSEITT